MTIKLVHGSEQRFRFRCPNITIHGQMEDKKMPILAAGVTLNGGASRPLYVEQDPILVWTGCTDIRLRRPNSGAASRASSVLRSLRSIRNCARDQTTSIFACVIQVAKRRRRRFTSAGIQNPCHYRSICTT